MCQGCLRFLTKAGTLGANCEVFTKTYLIKVLASGESCLQEISVPKLNPFSEVDININRCTDRALHVHTHLGIAFY